LANNVIDKIQHFGVKWVSISHQGNTCKPMNHLGQGGEARAYLFRAKESKSSNTRPTPEGNP
jgi:hypothetical protein